MKGVPRTVELHTDLKDCVNQDLSCIISIIIFGKTVLVDYCHNISQTSLLE